MRSLLRHGLVEREFLAFVVVRMVPLLFDVLFPIIHVARFGLNVGRPAAGTTIQQYQPPRAGAHNPSGSPIP
jgi:hypothetical protein